MNQQANVKPKPATASLVKTDPNSPALLVTGRDQVTVKAGTVFAGVTFDKDTAVVFDVALEPGSDYGVVVKDGKLGYVQLTSTPTAADILGGFHFAPGGNAAARSGGDKQPAINACSVWDQNFRPDCPDPRAMALIEMLNGKRFWADIYLLGKNHLVDGTSKFGAAIADGDECPQKPSGGFFKKLDYDTACAVMKHHGKGLLSFEEFTAAAFGVTEKTACDDEPEITSLDAARTSKFGLMQVTGNMWQWDHDGDPDLPRASFFGGCWLDGGVAGSRRAIVAYYWPGSSDGDLGARGRGDHLQPG